MSTSGPITGRNSGIRSIGLATQIPATTIATRARRGTRGSRRSRRTAVTQSGTNEWRGRVYGFLRNQRFDARNPLAPRKDPLTQSQYGASLGGPVRHDRTFLFANFEQTQRNDASVITVAPADVALINARLDAVKYRGALIETELAPSGFDVTNLFARLDHQLNGANSLTARYSLYRLTAIALPMIRDFRGVGNKLDGKGNYSLGITDHTIFPETQGDGSQKANIGMDITIVTTAATDDEARELIRLMGMPFRKSAAAAAAEAAKN